MVLKKNVSKYFFETENIFFKMVCYQLEQLNLSKSHLIIETVKFFRNVRNIQRDTKQKFEKFLKQ